MHAKVGLKVGFKGVVEAVGVSLRAPQASVSQSSVRELWVFTMIPCTVSARASKRGAEDVLKPFSEYLQRPEADHFLMFPT